QNDVTLKMPAFEWVHVQLHQQKGMISLSPPTICNSAEQVRMLRQEGKITLPSSIELELATNPFLRAESVDEFAHLRSLKDNF
ncbi:hydroxyacylglutathione hydrolase C-terminal domain-containing protein, partial [Acinetobacter baumannii]